MSRVLILSSCKQCIYHKDRCILSNKDFPTDAPYVFPEWCELRTPKEYYEYISNQT